ncbi:MAG: hypothetical protein Q8P99_02235 [bacterium]|nr:hypothetical protein [bacterium]MDZ4346145.1 hypothetical protein [Candidatus Binatia bacterium]
MNKSKIIITGVVVVVVGALLIGGIYLRNRTRENALLEKEYEARVSIEQYQIQLEDKNKLVAELPYRTSGFEVHYGLRDRVAMDVFYLILVKVDPNTASNIQQEMLEANKTAALSWIGEQGVDPGSLEIEFEQVEEFPS